MKTHAFIQNGEVAEIILPIAGPDGKELDINDRFAPAFVAVMVDVTDLDPQPGLHWRYIDEVFTEPVKIVNPD